MVTVTVQCGRAITHRMSIESGIPRPLWKRTANGLTPATRKKACELHARRMLLSARAWNCCRPARVQGAAGGLIVHTYSQRCSRVNRPNVVSSASRHQGVSLCRDCHLGSRGRFIPCPFLGARASPEASRSLAFLPYRTRAPRSCLKSCLSNARRAMPDVQSHPC